MNVIGIDVGTTSVRLAIISFRGDDSQSVVVLSSHEKEISHFQDGVKFEQSSQEIWDAICYCCKESLKKANISGNAIRGIAFSATCSLVIVDDELNKLKYPNDVIMWMDHRAIEEAQVVSESGSKVLAQFGGICSPEFSLSKLIWLKKHQPTRLEAARGIFELPDWLVYRCLDDTVAENCPRSVCCLTCKWGFNPDEKQHCEYVMQLGPKVGEKVGTKFYGPGKLAGSLGHRSAQELGLLESAQLNDLNKENTEPKLEVAVGVSLIDAHSGMLAMLSLPLQEYGIASCRIGSTFCSLAGTSSCHMLLSEEQTFVKGIWGPYKNVILDDYYLLEAGQSLTGKLIEICITTHEEGKAMLAGGKRLYDVIQELNSGLINGRANSTQGSCTDLLVLPFFHGNRSPLANPRLMGGVYGLKASGTRSLMEYYVATIESICYETKSIVETLGTKLDTMLVSGGLMKNTYYMQTLANVLNCRVLKMSLDDIDFMVMGSALVARQAVKNSVNMSPDPANETRNQSLNRSSIENIHYEQLYALEKYEPQKNKLSYHREKYLCYKEFVDFSLRIDKISNCSR